MATGGVDGSGLPATVDAERFKDAFRRHAAGVAVVTAEVDGSPHALTASSVSSVSADPAVVLFSVATSTVTGAAVATAGSAAVHLLDADDLALAVRCADPGADRFSGEHPWSRLGTGEPVFDGPQLVLRGEVVGRMTFGTSVVIALAVTDLIDRRAAARDAASDAPTDEEDARATPLAYVDRQWHTLGPASTIG